MFSSAWSKVLGRKVTPRLLDWAACYPFANTHLCANSQRGKNLKISKHKSKVWSFSQQTFIRNKTLKESAVCGLYLQLLPLRGLQTTHLMDSEHSAAAEALFWTQRTQQESVPKMTVTPPSASVFTLLLGTLSNYEMKKWCNSFFSC